MHLYWYGQSCFKIQTNNTVIFTDPYHKELGLVPPRTKANIVTVSHAHQDHNNIEAVADEKTKVFDSPGEYETQGVEIIGMAAFHDDKEGKKAGPNVVFVFQAEGMRLCHLGDLGHSLNEDQMEKINGVDILLIAVGEYNAVSAKEAAKLVSEIDPRIVIPMHYKIPGLKNKNKISGVEKFCEEMGTKKSQALDKFLAKKKNLPQEETQLVILKHLG